MHETQPNQGTPFAKAFAATAEPVTPTDSKHERVFAAAAAEAIELSSRRQHRRRLVATMIAVPMFLIAGSGAAYAATTIDWSFYWENTTTTEWTGWAENPDATVSYTLPSARSCELRLGEFAFSPAEDRPADVLADPRVATAATDFARSSLMITDADVQKVIAENRSDYNSAIGDDGTETPFGYGTANYDADVEYDTAVLEAVHDAINTHLATLGIPSTGLTYNGQQQCTGTDQ